MKEETPPSRSITGKEIINRWEQKRSGGIMLISSYRKRPNRMEKISFSELVKSGKIYTENREDLAWINDLISESVSRNFTGELMFKFEASRIVYAYRKEVLVPPIMKIRKKRKKYLDIVSRKLYGETSITFEAGHIIRASTSESIRP